MVSTKVEILGILSRIADPEIPVLNIVEMGIVRDAEVKGGTVHVDITPTYSGCPAMKVIQDDIVSALKAHGFPNVSVNTIYSPAWTTAWMSDATKLKLKEYGIAPPGNRTERVVVLIPGMKEVIPCPFCGSERTELRSEFGATACKSLLYCADCRQPFEYFKDI